MKKYKVLLVDDDSLVRVGLKSFIHWEEKGLCIAGEASDGSEALRLVAELRPDIVITDMYMPGYNGLRFIQEASASYPDTLFIVLSCHNDIYYIKESLHLGVYDYLLKSSIVDSGELDVVLGNAVRTLDTRRTTIATPALQPLPPHQVLLAYLEGERGLEAQMAQLLQKHNIDTNSRSLFLIALQMDNSDTCLSVFKDAELQNYAVENILEEIIKEYGGGLVFHSKDVFCLLFNVVTKNSFISPKDKALSICERLRISIKNNLKNTCSVYMDNGCTQSGLPECYRDIVEEISANRPLYYDTIVNLADSTPPLCVKLPEPPLPLCTDPVNSVLNYIHKNYRTQITLEDLAQVSNFSKYHLCKKFKQKTKTSIINYIMMVRVDKAKELLLQNREKIFVIAQDVGFNDASYFNRIFKKLTGYTPKEFVEYNQSVL